MKTIFTIIAAHILVLKASRRGSAKIVPALAYFKLNSVGGYLEASDGPEVCLAILLHSALGSETLSQEDGDIGDLILCQAGCNFNSCEKAFPYFWVTFVNLDDFLHLKRYFPLNMTNL